MKCPKGNRICDLLSPVTIYEEFGRKLIILETCLSTKPERYSYFVDMDKYGCYKLCRKNLYKETGKTTVRNQYEGDWEN